MTQIGAGEEVRELGTGPKRADQRVCVGMRSIQQRGSVLEGFMTLTVVIKI